MSQQFENILQAVAIGKLPIFDSQSNIDFNKIVSEPDSMQCCPEQYRTIYAKRRHMKNSPLQVWFNRKKWRYDYWGTEQNAFQSNHGDNEISFFTEDYIPFPIFSELSKQLGNNTLLIFVNNYTNPDMPCYKYLWLNGYMIQAYIAQSLYDTYETTDVIERFQKPEKPSILPTRKRI